MLSDRFMISDKQWELIEPHCLGRKSDPGRSGSDSRLFVEAVLWTARTGAPWRDLPAEFGKWNSVFKRFRYWVKRDVFRFFSYTCPQKVTSNIRWLMARFAKCTVTDRAQKGDSKSGHREIQGRNDHQNSCPDRRSWQSDRLQTDARTGG